MKKLFPYALIVFLFTLSILLFLLIPNDANRSAEESLTASTHQLADALQLADRQKINYSQSITVNAIGDILVHNPVYESAKTTEGYDFKPMFEPIKKYLEAADITIANQESIIGGEEIGLSSYPSFNSPYEVADALKDAGVDIVSMANNHTLDRGEQAILNATNYLNQVGIAYVGAYRNEKDRNQPRMITKNGISVGFLSYTYGTNGIPIPDGKDHLVNYIEQEQILHDLDELQNQVDFVFVSMHFGSEYEPLPNDEQIYLTDLLTNNGADVIIGHHPHVLQPVDWISVNGEHERFANYSLGNFLSNQKGLDRNIGAISQITLTKERKNGGFTHSVSNASMMPTYNTSAEYGFKIVPLIDAAQYGLTDANRVFQNTAQHLKTFTDEIEVIPYLDAVQ